ncbi:MAG: hypothetical protein ACO3JL_21120 [Myxococcota bacterium]
MPAEKYAAVKEYVRVVGGLRVSTAGGFRDRVVEWCVEDWPAGASPDTLREVLLARVAVRVRRQHSGVLATMLIYVIASKIVSLVVDWWLHHRDNRTMMDAWRRDASSR